MLYDADRVEEAASTPDQTKLAKPNWTTNFLDPNDPKLSTKLKEGISMK